MPKNNYLLTKLFNIYLERGNIIREPQKEILLLILYSLPKERPGVYIDMK